MRVKGWWGQGWWDLGDRILGRWDQGGRVNGYGVKGCWGLGVVCVLLNYQIIMNSI